VEKTVTRSQAFARAAPEEIGHLYPVCKAEAIDQEARVIDEELGKRV
jgi:hypothetical protein